MKISFEIFINNFIEYANKQQLITLQELIDNNMKLEAKKYMLKIITKFKVEEEIN